MSRDIEAIQAEADAIVTEVGWNHAPSLLPGSSETGLGPPLAKAPLPTLTSNPPLSRTSMPLVEWSSLPRIPKLQERRH